MAIQNSVSNYFLTTFLDSIVFDCHLSRVVITDVVDPADHDSVVIALVSDVMAHVTTACSINTPHSCWVQPSPGYPFTT